MSFSHHQQPEHIKAAKNKMDRRYNRLFDKLSALSVVDDVNMFKQSLEKLRNKISQLAENYAGLAGFCHHKADKEFLVKERELTYVGLSTELEALADKLVKKYQGSNSEIAIEYLQIARNSYRDAHRYLRDSGTTEAEELARFQLLSKTLADMRKILVGKGVEDDYIDIPPSSSSSTGVSLYQLAEAARESSFSVASEDLKPSLFEKDIENLKKMGSDLFKLCQKPGHAANIDHHAEKLVNYLDETASLLRKVVANNPLRDDKIKKYYKKLFVTYLHEMQDILIESGWDSKQGLSHINNEKDKHLRYYNLWSVKKLAVSWQDGSSTADEVDIKTLANNFYKHLNNFLKKFRQNKHENKHDNMVESKENAEQGEDKRFTHSNHSRNDHSRNDDEKADTTADSHPAKRHRSGY